jgi:hypothetical protein
MTIESMLYLLLGLLGGCTVAVVVVSLLRAGGDIHTVNARELASAYLMGYQDATSGLLPDTTRPAPLLEENG